MELWRGRRWMHPIWKTEDCEGEEDECNMNVVL